MTGKMVIVEPSVLVKESSVNSKPNRGDAATNPPDPTAPVDFEEAIAATSYGKFNVFLMLIALPCCMSCVYESACISYIIPTAECDLQLSLIGKGLLNAVVYAGMITSAIPWGYYADRLGRRKLLIYGLFLNSMCMLASSMSRNLWVLMVFKYFGGFIMCGPFAVLMSYVSEFHGIKHRSRVMLILGMFFSVATISLPAIGWLVLPIPWSLQFSTNFSMKSWQMFLAICALPSLVGSIGLMFMPESPRFLMTNDMNSEALDVMRLVYSWNTGKEKALYPVSQLCRESIELSAMTGFEPIKPLLRKPLLSKCVLVLTIQFCSLLGQNTMRLWLPQLYAIVGNYDQLAISDNNVPHNLCEMIATSVNQSDLMLADDYTSDCSDSTVNESMYMNTIYSGTVGLFGYLIAGCLIKIVGTNNLIIYGLAVVGMCGIGLFWATNTLATVVLTSIYVSLGSICTTAFIGVIVNIFPTSLRTLAISLGMMFGRVGALIGNVTFPYLLSVGCLPPFLMVGLVMLVSSILSMALPSSSSNALK